LEPRFLLIGQRRVSISCLFLTVWRLPKWQRWTFRSCKGVLGVVCNTGAWNSNSFGRLWYDPNA
jgi:hypothetical protein